METIKAMSLMFYVFFCFLIFSCHALDTLRPGKILQSNETLSSKNNMFELGFVGLGHSSQKYLGIWFKHDNTKKPVWIANREDPVVDSSGFFRIRFDGNLLLSDRRAVPFLINNGNLATSNQTVCRLLDSGNLVLIDGENAMSLIWQSFDYPTDTFLPGMKLGSYNIGSENLKIQFLISWLSPVVPGTGEYALGIDSQNLTRFNVWRRDRAYQEVGSWDGNEFRFFFMDSSSSEYNFTYEANQTSGFITFTNKDSDIISWFVLSHNGAIIEFKMKGDEISSVSHSLCDDKLIRNSSDCLVISPNMCSDEDDFSVTSGKIPRLVSVVKEAPSNLRDCELICKRNCTCSAYTFLDDDGCEIFYGSRDNLLKLLDKGNNTVYVRNNASKSGDRTRNLLIIITSVVLPAILLTLILISCLLRKRHLLGINSSRGSERDDVSLLLGRLGVDTDQKDADIIELGKKNEHDLPLVSFSSLEKATDHFSFANKLGQGGYGPVYKGNIQGHGIAVKRLSQNSGQGLIEFMNEVELISKLQHRNLVKLLGCCVEGTEKILIYEYMPNKSLDSFLFDPLKSPVLDWEKRRNIMEGIAQGLLYLHKYSRLRIIHRDLKTSNILLDENMTPKISDFGLARIFVDNESQSKTKRLAGTYGYMAPEYAIHGVFSTKSDVFSFGVILLELVSGKKNTTFQHPSSSLNLLGYVWELWSSECFSDLIDQTMAGDSCPLEDVMLCIKIGLLCVQECADDRPSMSDVVSMLSSDGTSLPTPKQPAFSTLLSALVDSESKKQSQNLATITAIEGR